MFNIFKRKKNKVQSQPNLPPIPQRPKDSFTAKVAGVSYREKELTEFMGGNSVFYNGKRDLFDLGLTNERVYEYKEIYTSHAQLVPEPDNPVDPKAIKVLIDGHHIGYIKKGSTGRIHNLLNANKIKNVEAILHGGKYKLLLGSVPEDEDRDERVSDFELIKDEVPINCMLTVWYFTD